MAGGHVLLRTCFSRPREPPFVCIEQLLLSLFSTRSPPLQAPLIPCSSKAQQASQQRQALLLPIPNRASQLGLPLPRRLALASSLASPCAPPDPLGNCPFEPGLTRHPAPHSPFRLSPVSPPRSLPTCACLCSARRLFDWMSIRVTVSASSSSTRFVPLSRAHACSRPPGDRRPSKPHPPCFLKRSHAFIPNSAS
jgi:hypothetical protein